MSEPIPGTPTTDFISESIKWTIAFELVMEARDLVKRAGSYSSDHVHWVSYQPALKTAVEAVAGEKVWKKEAVRDLNLEAVPALIKEAREVVKRKGSYSKDHINWHWYEEKLNNAAGRAEEFRWVDVYEVPVTGRTL